MNEHGWKKYILRKYEIVANICKTSCCDSKLVEVTSRSVQRVYLQSFVQIGHMNLFLNMKYFIDPSRDINFSAFARSIGREHENTQ